MGFRYDVPVYFVQHGDRSGLIKIGFSLNIPARLVALQATAPLTVNLLGWVWGGPDEEKRLHALFDDYHSHGEWFFPTKTLLAYIERHAEDSPPPWAERPLSNVEIEWRVAANVTAPAPPNPHGLTAASLKRVRT